MNLVEEKDYKGVLQPNENVLKESQKLHPLHRQVVKYETMQGSPPEINPAVFESLNHSGVYHVAVQTRGSSGPSGLDNPIYQRLACRNKFKQSKGNFCNTLLEIARKICGEIFDPLAPETNTACRSIAFAKDG